MKKFQVTYLSCNGETWTHVFSGETITEVLASEVQTANFGGIYRVISIVELDPST